MVHIVDSILEQFNTIVFLWCFDTNLKLMEKLRHSLLADTLLAHLFEHVK